MTTITGYETGPRGESRPVADHGDDPRIPAPINH